MGKIENKTDKIHIPLCHCSGNNGARKSITPNYQQVITEYPEQGWRFVQLIIDNPASIPSEYVLIFERPVS